MKRSATRASLPGHPENDLTVPPIPREALLPLPEVVRLTSLSQTVIYERMAAGTFPLARHLGPRRVAWPAAEVLDWIAALPKWKPGGAE
jgi:predicted DNA-binding transcriptional regulator AlpA